MIEDKDTNIVYISKWLKVEQEEFYHRLIALFESLDIKYDFLKYTNDYWCRDYMPIQLSKDRFIKYYYHPDYLLNSKEDKDTITNSSRACKCIGIQYAESDIVIDGGNVVLCGEDILMTDKVITENRHFISTLHSDFIAELSRLFGKRIVIVPWIQHGDDVFGHTDGYFKYAGENKILMSNLIDEYPAEALIKQEILEQNGYEVTHLHFENNLEYNWAYINFLQVGDKIIMPAFDVKEDEQAMNQIHNMFPYCSIHPIEMKKIAKEGGALHCITWNIKI